MIMEVFSHTLAVFHDGSWIIASFVFNMLFKTYKLLFLPLVPKDLLQTNRYEDYILFYFLSAYVYE